MEALGPSSGVVVYLADRKAAPSQSEDQGTAPPPPPTVADISIHLFANGDVTYERHNVTVYTAKALMLGCFSMLGETMEIAVDG